MAKDCCATSTSSQKSTVKSKFLTKPRMRVKYDVKICHGEKEEKNTMKAKKLLVLRVIKNYRNKCLAGMESSHGRTWFRGPQLGKGSFASVFLATRNENSTADEHPEPEMIAVKSVEIKNSKSLKKEKKILCCLKHSPYIIKCYGDEITKSGDGEKTYYNLLLEYASGGSLSQRIKKSGGLGLPEDEVRRYTRGIIKGIFYIHCNGYTHCDIKPDNILLVPDPDDGSIQAKIGDFGLTKSHFFLDEEDYQPEMRGIFRYMAPEILRDHITEPAADIWALGCTVIEMLSGKAVWGFENELQNDKKWVDDLFGRIAFSPELPEMPSSISEECKDFLMKCFVNDTRDRWTAGDLIEHPFLSLVLISLLCFY